jgi:hypothetical protein
MALVEGTNSFCTVVFADTYAADREGTDDFVNLFEEDKERLLISATDLLDTFVWVGSMAVSTQDLTWPRDAEYHDPRLGAYVVLDNETPIAIQEATVELAMSFVASGSYTGAGGGAKSGSPNAIKVGSIELDGLNDTDRENIVIGGVAIPTMVANLISPLLGKAAVGSGLFRPWFRAN